MTTIPSELVGIIKCYGLGLHFGKHGSYGFVTCWYLQLGTDAPVAYSETL